MNYTNSRRVGTVAVLFAVALMYLLTPAAAHAQSVRMTAKIPFDFYVDGQKRPAGEYVATPLSGGMVIQLSDGESGRHLSFQMTLPGSYKNNASGAFVFNRFNNYYFLSELRWPGHDTGRSLKKSSLELEVASTVPKRVISVPGNER